MLETIFLGSAGGVEAPVSSRGWQARALRCSPSWARAPPGTRSGFRWLFPRKRKGGTNGSAGTKISLLIGEKMAKVKVCMTSKHGKEAVVAILGSKFPSVLIF
jgi:hypothetical protein